MRPDTKGYKQITIYQFLVLCLKEVTDKNHKFCDKYIQQRGNDVHTTILGLVLENKIRVLEFALISNRHTNYTIPYL